MSISALASRLSNSVQFRMDRVIAEPANRRLDARYAADPARWLDRIDVAVSRGCKWFAPQHDLSMSALLVLDQAYRQTGDARLAFVGERARRYAATYYDPGLRTVLRDYDPEAHEHLPDINETRPYQVIELMMIDAINLDRRGDPENLMRYLAALADNGGYGSTHIMVGGLLMKRAGVDLDGKVDRMIAGQIDVVAAGNRAVSYAGDLFAERIFVLEWVNRHDLVSPAWLLRLLRAQRPDGGWRGRNVPPVGQSNQHTTSLAMAALAMFRKGELESMALNGAA